MDISKKEQLELKKMMMELEYLLMEEEYKKAVIEEHKPEFLGKAGSPKQEEPKKSPEPLPAGEGEGGGAEADPAAEKEGVASPYIRDKVKKLYREIAKLTHPDKGGADVEAYISAKKAAKEFDLISIYRICDSLGIAYSVEAEDKQALREKIDGMRSRLKSIESSFIWLYAEAKTDAEKDALVARFRAMYCG